MRFIFSADWHLSRYGQDKMEDVSNLPQRLHGIKTSMYQMTDHCREFDIGTIVIGGDSLHGKSVIYAIAQNILLDFFRDNNDIQFIVIDGNHDLAGKGAGASSALKSIDNEPNVNRIQGLFARIGDILFVPYSYKLTDVIKQSDAKVLVSHFGLNEGVLNSGISIVADVGLKDLRNRYETVLLGHYHKPQEIIEPNLSVYYVGSPIQLDWGEKHEEKRFLVVDTDKGTVESVLTKGYRKYCIFELTNENKTEVITQARSLIKDGHNVSIKRIEDVDIDGMDKEFRLVDRVEKDITSRGITSEMSDKDKIYKYLEIKGINKEKQDLWAQTAFDIILSCSEIQQEG